jgi:hypothetical protein
VGQVVTAQNMQWTLKASTWKIGKRNGRIELQGMFEKVTVGLSNE